MQLLPAPLGGFRRRLQNQDLRIMKKLLKGLRQFKSNYFSTHQELFEQLSHGQKPRVLFITCSDSRIDPNLITNAEVGELFVIRNAGNIIPPSVLPMVGKEQRWNMRCRR